ncbi:hypothetical protein P7J55_10125 [Streptococcus suis]|uniref:hypothetical protein n=1 Tax=Streptococcus suis TaxID=1307 RepID=UPI0038B7F943
MVWIVAKKNKRGRRKYHYKKCFDSWQVARVYQQDLWNKGINAEMWEENGGIEIGKCK